MLTVAGGNADCNSLLLRYLWTNFNFFFKVMRMNHISKPIFIQFYVKLTKFNTGAFFCDNLPFPSVAESIFDSILIS